MYVYNLINNLFDSDNLMYNKCLTSNDNAVAENSRMIDQLFIRQGAVSSMLAVTFLFPPSSQLLSMVTPADKKLCASKITLVVLILDAKNIHDFTHNFNEHLIHQTLKHVPM